MCVWGAGGTHSKQKQGKNKFSALKEDNSMENRITKQQATDEGLQISRKKHTEMLRECTVARLDWSYFWKDLCRN